MITPAPLIAAAAKRLRQRSYHDSDGAVRMVLQNGGAVSLTRKQYADLLTDFAEAMKPVDRRLRLGFTLTIPVMIITLALLVNIGLDDLISAITLPGASLALGLISITWWPNWVLVRHWRETKAVNASLDAQLATLPSAPMPPDRPRSFHNLEIIALFIVGPGILIDVAGSLYPDAFDGTPLTGRAIGPLTICGIALFLSIVGRHIFFGLKGVGKQAERDPVSAFTTTERLSAVSGRARAAEQTREI